MIDYFCDKDATASGQGSERRFLYLVFEYMDTTLWREFSRRKGLFDRQMTIRIFRDVCLGVKHLHDVGIVHGDLSLTNMLYSHGTLKVADLGCSSCAATWVLPNSETCTAHSRAPELWLASGGKTASRLPASSQLVETVATAVDCWSLGVCLGILLTGEFIFQSFAQIVSCLGPLTNAEWAGCTSLPGYGTLKVAEQSSKFGGHGAHVLNFFSCEQHVKYPKPVEDSGLDLIGMLLKWPPNDRFTVQQSLDHNLLGDVFDFVAVLRTCSHDQLGKLVIDSIRSGVPVRSADILAASAPVLQGGHKRPRTVDGHSEAEKDSSPGKSLCTGIAHNAANPNKAALQGEQQTGCPDKHSETAESSGIAKPAHGVQDLNACLCACRGLCRRASCVKACNAAAYWKKKNPRCERRKIQICDQPHLQFFRFCFACKCEVTDCDRTRDKSHILSGRWCYIHGNAFVSDRKRYPNASGQQLYGSRWSSHLRLTARLAFLLQDMIPQDMTAAFDFCKKLRIIRRDQPMRKEDLMWMVLASALEWPVAIDALWDAVAQKLHAEPTAEDVRDCVQKAIDASSVIEMHAEISATGRAAGPAWVGLHLGFAETEAETEKTEDTSRRRQRTKASGQPNTAGNTIQFGKTVRLLARPDVLLTHCGRMVYEAMRVDLEWPGSSEPGVVRAFAKRVVEFVGQGFQITRETAQDSCDVSTVVRKVLLVASEFVPAVFDQCSMSDIVKWTHDEGSYADPLMSMDGAELRRRFGMQPLMIGFWTSHFECCDAREKRALMQADDTRLLQVLAELRSIGHRVPRADTIARSLLGDNNRT